MNKFLFYTLLVCSFIAQNEQISEAGKPRRNDRMSFIILGDIHYCDENHYDLDAMQRDKPSDYRQITGTYAPVTKSNWADMTSVIRQSIRSTDPPIKCIIQLGDISEGLANIPGQADIIAEDVTSMLEAQDFKVPFIYAKGNHDITGIGELRAEARQAFSKHHVPYLKKQTGNNGITEGNYTYTEGDVLFVMLDAYNPSIDQTEFLKQSLESSSAKYKFVCMHEPAIPASERCWHYLKSGSAAERDREQGLFPVRASTQIFSAPQKYRMGSDSTGDGNKRHVSKTQKQAFIRTQDGRLRSRSRRPCTVLES